MHARPSVVTDPQVTLNVLYNIFPNKVKCQNDFKELGKVKQSFKIVVWM